MRYYKEKNGDFLCIEPSTKKYYQRIYHRNEFEGRACTIENLPSSICTTGILEDYLKECTRVYKKNVPKEYLNQM